jgi:hypothetical protein
VLDGGLRGDRRAERGVEIGAAGYHAADRADELAVRRLLEHIRRGAGAQGGAGHRGVGLHRQDHHPRARRVPRQVGEDGEPRAARHGEVEDEHVGPVAAHLARRRVRVGALGHDLPSGFGVEQHAQTGAHDGVVVGQHDAQIAHWSSSLAPASTAARDSVEAS